MGGIDNLEELCIDCDECLGGTCGIVSMEVLVVHESNLTFAMRVYGCAVDSRLRHI